MISKKCIRDIPNLKSKRVFLTVDFNISLHNGVVANDTRIVEALPTIQYLHEKGARLILASHLGRPKGHDPAFSLKPVAQRLQSLTGIKVNLLDDVCSPKIYKSIETIPQKELILLENIRFCKGEKTNDPEFAAHLGGMADIFVNDAFGASHRIHASIVGISQHLPSYAGLLLDKEIRILSQALYRPKRPFVVFIGGAKTPEKIAVIENLLDKADTIALGGAIANTFLAAWGFGMGRSLVDYEMVEMARVVFWKAVRKHSAIMLPTDVVICDHERHEKPVEVSYKDIPSNVVIFDIGRKTRAFYAELIKSAGTIIWNGPMGLYEDIRFKKGTDELLKQIAGSKALSIVGGGDTLTSIKTKTYLEKISHVSTGGSAMLAFLEKGTLPGIEVLKNK